MIFKVLCSLLDVFIFSKNFIGDEASRLFLNLRNKYSRDKKRMDVSKKSGSSSQGVQQAKQESSELYKYLAWLDPYVQQRKTSSNFVVVDDSDTSILEHEEEHDDDQVSIKSESSVKR